MYKSMKYDQLQESCWLAYFGAYGYFAYSSSYLLIYYFLDYYYLTKLYVILIFDLVLNLKFWIIILIISDDNITL